MLSKMKRLLVVFAILLAVFSADAQGVTFFEGSFADCLKSAKSKDKMVFIDFYTKWCTYCRKMEKEVFVSPLLKDYFDNKFIAIKVDAESEEGKIIAQKYEVAAYPTLVIIAPTGEEVLSSEGYMGAEQLLRWLQLELGETMTYEQMYEKYRDDKSNHQLVQKLLIYAPEFIAKQTEQYKAEQWEVRVERLYAAYRKEKSVADMMNPEDFRILMQYHVEMADNDEVFEYVVANYDNVIKSVPKSDVDGFLCMLHMQLLNTKAERGDLSYRTALERLNGDLKIPYSSVFKSNEMDPYLCMKYITDASYEIYANKSVDKYIALMDEYLGKLGQYALSADYSSAIRTLYEALDGKLPEAATKKGIEWISTALQFEGLDVGEQMELLIMNGDCYKMLGDKENARNCYKQAFAVSLQFESMMISGQIQRMIDSLDE